ncbi:hypothetical protein VTK56DRAFT_8724 [Thermocarpiscus australiensis]
MMYLLDDWPKTPDGADYDGKELFSLTRSGKRPFAPAWVIQLMIQEIEDNLGTKVVDIPNNYGFHSKLSNRPDMVARLARGDVNMPDFDGLPIHVQF